jgi:hypothetical protein
MSRIANPLLMLVPHELLGGFLLLFIVLGGLCRIVGAKKQSNALILIAIAIPFITVLVEGLCNELFAGLPPWTVKPIAWLTLIVVYVAIFSGLIALLFGTKAWDAAKGHLLAKAITELLRLLLWWPLLLLFAGLAVYAWLK